MKSPIEKVKEEQGLTIQELAIAADVATMTAYKNIKAENREPNPKILDTLEEMGYDRDRIEWQYSKYREEKRAELIS